VKFGKLKIQNFMSFRKAEIDLSIPGCTLVEGIVSDSTSFDSNGAGKSNLFSEALPWILFGKTLKESNSKDDIINESIGKNCYGYVDVTINNERYRIKRYRKHKKYKNKVFIKKYSDSSQLQSEAGNGGTKWRNLTLSSCKQTGRFIESLLGLDYKTFINSIIFGQGSIKRISTSSDREIKDILEGVLNFDYLTTGYKKVSDILKELEKKRIYLRDRELLLYSKKSDLKKSIRNELRVQDIRTQDNLGSVYTTLDQITDIQIKINKLESEVLPFNPDGDIKRISKQLDDIGDIPEYKGDIERLGLEISNLVEEYGVRKHHDELSVGYECDTCGQVITKKAAKRYMASVHKELKKMDRKIKILERKRNRLVEKDAALDITRAKKISLLNDLSSARKNLSRSEKTLIKICSLYEKLDLVFESVRYYSKRDEYKISHLNDMNTQVRLLELEHTGIQEKMDEVELEIEYYEFWKEGFSNRGIKSLVVNSVIPFINDKANYYSSILTGGTINIKLKKGDTVEKVLLKCRKEKGGQSYGLISGGEKRRVDICVALALRDLVASRGSKPTRLLILDEAFESLDLSGADRVVELVLELSKEKDSVFLITHQQGLKDYFNDRIIIENDKGLSRVVEYGKLKEEGK